MNAIKIAKLLMKLRERIPSSPDKTLGELQEIFCHNMFLKASESTKKELMLKSSNTKYVSELDYPWDNYFDRDISPYLNNKVILDLGCFNGGRGVAWFERYKLDKLFGIDVDQIYIDSATQFASTKGINAEYKLAKGEKLPFEDATFDAILSFDVFEHVQNIETTLKECWRVLKPNGKLFVVFPGYFHPIEHHLGLVTKTPFFHYFFSSETLIGAYSEILEERGQDAYWYKRSSPKPETWERCNTINGTTLKKFKNIIENKDWKITFHSRKPIGSIGRNVSKKKWLLVMSYLFYPLTFIPGIQEILLHRITYVLEKQNND
jgi:SAM-dependent methyltransferase